MSVPTVEGTPLPRPIVVMVGLATVFVVVAGLRGLSDIIGPTFLALVLTIAAHPLRRWVAGHGLPGWVGSVLAILVIYGGLVGLTFAMLVAGARFAALLPTYQEELQRMLQNALAWLDSVGVHQQQVDAFSQTLDLGRLVAFLGDVLGGLVGVLSSLLFVVTLVLFMVVDATGFTPKLGELPAGAARAGRRAARLRRRAPGSTWSSPRSSVSSWRPSTPRRSSGSGSLSRCCGGCWPSSPTTSRTSGS